MVLSLLEPRLCLDSVEDDDVKMDEVGHGWIQLMMMNEVMMDEVMCIDKNPRFNVLITFTAKRSMRNF